LIERHKTSEGNTLLDVACGTGTHLSHLQDAFDTEGLDLDNDLLDIARQRLPDVAFHHADMVEFDLERRFDIVLCLFSAIGYVKTVPRLRQSISNMAHHLKPGGVLIIEPWMLPEFFNAKGLFAHFVDEDDLKITRITRSHTENGVSMLEFHYLIGTPEGVEYFEEVHEMGLFSDAQYREAITDTGLKVSKDFPGLTNRGLYIGG
jgi:SAM-dependent methyltransferase